MATYIQQETCKGCLNREDGRFPFGKYQDGNTLIHFIDTEGCGEVDLVETRSFPLQVLVVHFCPVCGRKL